MPNNENLEHRLLHRLFVFLSYLINKPFNDLANVLDRNIFELSEKFIASFRSLERAQITSPSLQQFCAIFMIQRPSTYAIIHRRPVPPVGYIWIGRNSQQKRDSQDTPFGRGLEEGETGKGGKQTHEENEEQRVVALSDTG